MNVRFIYAFTATLATWISCVLVYLANEWMVEGVGLNPWLALPLATIFVGIMPIWALLADEDMERELAERQDAPDVEEHQAAVSESFPLMEDLDDDDAAAFLPFYHLSPAPVPGTKPHLAPSIREGMLFLTEQDAYKWLDRCGDECCEWTVFKTYIAKYWINNTDKYRCMWAE